MKHTNTKHKHTNFIKHTNTKHKHTKTIYNDNENKHKVFSKVMNLAKLGETCWSNLNKGRKYK
jgi:hypothetical protein